MRKNHGVNAGEKLGALEGPAGAHRHLCSWTVTHELGRKVGQMLKGLEHHMLRRLHFICAQDSDEPLKVSEESGAMRKLS